jgi:hypothetical protein
MKKEEPYIHQPDLDQENVSFRTLEGRPDNLSELKGIITYKV